MRTLLALSRRLVRGACALTILALLVALIGQPAPTWAAGPAPAQQAEQIRSQLLQAQLLLGSPAEARAQFQAAQALYSSALAPELAPRAPAADQQIQAGFAAASQALEQASAPAFAAARAQVWAGLLAGGFAAVQAALQAGSPAEAQAWLALREFRHATRFSRPSANATLSLAQFAAGAASAADTLQAVRADLLDTYQARLTEALDGQAQAETKGFAARQAELAALAQGYFGMLAPAYAEQRGDAALAQAQGAFEQLLSSAVAGQSAAPALAQVEAALAGFRAAPLTPAEQVRRANQVLRFLSLVPIEYGRGVSGGQITRDLEIREAQTFFAGASAAFNDLRTLLEARSAPRAAEASAQFDAIGQLLAAAGTQASVPEPAEIERQVGQLTAQLQELMPAEWQKHDSAADFDLIRSTLDQMESAAAAGQYDLAESARLDAYAILESGPEARLVVFAPQHKAPIEDLFWYGQGDNKGLAYLIGQRAEFGQIRASRAALEAELVAAEAALAGKNAPVAVATNAAIIVFREGLEAVLILASLMASLKLGEQRRYRRPLWWGAALAFLASALTWLLAQSLLGSLARFGERLEAVVSLIAIGVLLLITNWFFHKVYWTGWIANFHAKKRRLIGGAAGQWLGLALLGFTSIYREGFETVLFLQALVLEAGAPVVLGGVGIGLAGTLAIGLIIFAVQAKLPYKRMLIVTGVMIGAVLLQMVGNTTHVMQVVGWLPIHPIRWLSFPYWAGMWFGLYATYEGLLLQAAAASFVIGSYYLAERLQERPASQTAKPAPSAEAARMREQADRPATWPKRSS